jgi:hypothetical protein
MKDLIILARLDVIASARKMMEIEKLYSGFSPIDLMIQLDDGTQIAPPNCLPPLTRVRLYP